MNRIILTIILVSFVLADLLEDPDVRSDVGLSCFSVVFDSYKVEKWWSAWDSEEIEQLKFWPQCCNSDTAGLPQPGEQVELDADQVPTLSHHDWGFCKTKIFFILLLSELIDFDIKDRDQDDVAHEGQESHNEERMIELQLPNAGNRNFREKVISVIEESFSSMFTI